MKNPLESLKIRRISSFFRLPGLICLQLLVVLAFILLGTLISNNVEISEQLTDGGVRFIKSSSSSTNLTRNQTTAVKIYTTPTFMKLRRSSGEFAREFYVIRRTVEISSDIAERLQTTETCFREGTEPSSMSNRALNAAVAVTNKTENGDFDSSPACLCRASWHGASCSEPEIIWRAFLTARQPLRQPPKLTRTPHHVFQIISNASLLTLETLEIQIRELADVVDVFVLCDLISSDEPSMLIRHQMNRGGFLEMFQEQILLVKDVSCTRANVVRQMRKILGSQMRPLDVVVFSSSDEILNKKAVAYLKWHNNWPQPLVFRMRWNVYGFFFQRPDKTIINSIVCQLNVLEQVYKSNPDNIFKKKSQLLTVGDLNHFGGWYCEYCYQPIDIIRKLHLDSKLLGDKSSTSLLNGNYHRKPVINIEFIQNLIQQGIYIDGQTALVKLRSYDNEKYFVPECVAKNRGKFSNVVSNFYASWDESENDGYW